MRIDHLDFIAYGHFRDLKLDLSAGEPGFHVIYGANEAGKSTALRALTAWLFGIEHKTPDSFLHANEKLRIGGQLRLSDGKTLAFTRRKGRRNTLLAYGTDKALDDHKLHPFISGDMDKATFKLLWGINYHRLVTGGRELMESSGDIGRALFSAAMGIEGIRSIADHLHSELSNLFKPRASVLPLNQAIKAFKEAKNTRDQLVVSVSRWKELDGKIATLTAEISDCDGQITEKHKEKSRLSRLQKIKEPLAEYAQVSRDLESMAHGVLLDPDVREKYNLLINNIEHAKKTIAAEQNQIAAHQTGLAALTLREDILSHSHTITEILGERGLYENNLSRLPKLKKKSARSREAAEQGLAQIPNAQTLEDLESWRDLLEKKKTLRKEHLRFIKLNEKLELSNSDGKKKAKKLKRLEENKLTQSLEPECLAAAKSVLKLAQNEGHLEHAVDQAISDYEQKHGDCLTELAQLKEYQGTLDCLKREAFPSLVACDESESDINTLTEEIKHAGRLLKDHEKEHRELTRRLTLLTSKNKDIPSTETLLELRNARQDLWQYIKAQASHDHVLSVRQSYDFEKAMEQADDYADRMLAAAELVTKKAELKEQIDAQQIRINKCMNELAQLNENKAEFLKSWRLQWRESQVDVGANSPSAMRTLRIAMGDLQKRVMELAPLQQDVQRKSEQIKSHKASLSAQIGLLNPKFHPDGHSMESLKNILDDLIAKEEKIRTKAEKHQQDLQEASHDYEDHKQDHDQLEAKLEAWQSHWRKIWPNEIPSDISSHDLMDILDVLEDTFQHLNTQEETLSLIKEKEKECDKWTDCVQELSGALGFSSTEDAQNLMAQISEALQQAQDDKRKHDGWTEDIRKCERKIETARQELKQYEQKILKLKDKAKANSEDELVKAIELSESMRERQKRLTATRDELSRHSDGYQIPELNAQMELVDVDTLASEIGSLDHQIVELKEKRDGLRDQKARYEKEQDEINGTSEAAQAEQEVALKAAQIESHVENYIRLQAASLILAAEMDDYRRKNQAPVLKRASELFSRLTLGSYVGLEDDYQDGRPVLVGIKNNGQKITLKQDGDGPMSTGSRDQLYLALRLAMIEQHIQKQEPMPFIVDDVLIGFDDHRAKVCLEILSELSSKTQILLFTHHLRVLDMAEKLSQSGGAICHHLSQNRLA